MSIEDAVGFVNRCDIIPQREKDELREAVDSVVADKDRISREFDELRLAARKMVNALTARGLFNEPIFSRFAGEFRLFETILVRQEKDYGQAKEVHSNEQI